MRKLNLKGINVNNKQKAVSVQEQIEEQEQTSIHGGAPGDILEGYKKKHIPVIYSLRFLELLREEEESEYKKSITDSIESQQALFKQMATSELEEDKINELMLDKEKFYDIVNALSNDRGLTKMAYTKMNFDKIVTSFVGDNKNKYVQNEAIIYVYDLKSQTNISNNNFMKICLNVFNNVSSTNTTNAPVAAEVDVAPTVEQPEVPDTGPDTVVAAPAQAGTM